MANFKQAYATVVVGHEGGYVDDPADPGGETICGVARNRCVDWSGWETVDQVKRELVRNGDASNEDITRACMASEGFQEDLAAIYKEQYWDVFYGDVWTDRLQVNATEMFDAQVNTGRGIQFAQQACNVMNRNGRDWKDITVDGSFGPATWEAIRAAVEKRSPELFCKVQNLFQGIHYVRLMRKRPQRFERYVGWFNRI